MQLSANNVQIEAGGKECLGTREDAYYVSRLLGRAIIVKRLLHYVHYVRERDSATVFSSSQVKSDLAAVGIAAPPSGCLNQVGR